MLHWLAGQKQPEGPTDPDATGYTEPPETPAPVFAVRAFKHALFGTPQTTQPKPRRNSSTENARPRNGEIKTGRPGITRPKSASDAQMLGKPLLADLPEPLASPTKGILLTPGTAGGKKKNVTFGAHVADNEEKRPIRNGLSEDSPDAAFGSDSDRDEDMLGKSRGRGKLNDALKQARDESRKGKSKSERRSRRDTEDDLDIPAEFRDPKSDAGKYWKHEYDIYRANTQREVKKLITKQKAAKSFARDKDVECTQLSIDLREEQKKVESLEAKLEDLSSLMKDLHEELAASKKKEQAQAKELERLKEQTVRRDSMRPTSRDTAALFPLERSASAAKTDREADVRKDDPVQRPSEPYKPARTTDRPRLDLQTLRAKVKQPKADSNSPPKQSDDIWALRSSSPVATRTTNSAALAGTHFEEPGSKANPLQTLDVNTLPAARDSDRNTKRESRSKSPVHSPRSPVRETAATEQTAKSYFEGLPAQSKPDESEQTEDLSIPGPFSSPFQEDSQPFPPSPSPQVSRSRREAAPVGPREAPGPARSVPPSVNTKENISPATTASKVQGEQNEPQVKPSQLWTSISNGTNQKREVSLRSKDGRTVSAERVEAARARIAARGRVAS